MYSPFSRRRRSPPPRSPSLPSWYHRIVEYPDNTVSYEDFDEDISELSSESEHGDDCVCDCACSDCASGDEGSECGSESDEEGSESDSESVGDPEGWSTGYPSDDEGSENRSHVGSEYDYYYELKEQREERKRQIRQEAKDGKPTMKEETRKFEKNMEKEVKKVYYQLRHRRGRRQNLFLRGQVFKLGSLDHWQHAYLGHTPQFMSKYVEFYDYPEVRYDGAPESYRPPPGQEPDLVGHVHMNGTVASQFRGPAPPPRGNLREFTVENDDGEHNLVFQFLDNHHLIMKVPRELVFASHPRKIPPSAPKTFVFYGVEEDWAAGRRKSR